MVCSEKGISGLIVFQMWKLMLTLLRALGAHSAVAHCHATAVLLDSHCRFDYGMFAQPVDDLGRHFMHMTSRIAQIVAAEGHQFLVGRYTLLCDSNVRVAACPLSF